MIVPLLLFLLASITGPLNPVFIKTATTEMPPVTYSALRFFAAALILFPFWHQQKQIIKKKDLIKILPFSLNMVLFTIGIQYASNIVNGILYAFSPVLTAFFAHFLIKEKLSRVHVIALLFALFGVLVLIAGSIKTQDIRSFGMPIGTLLILAATCVWSLYPVGSRVLARSYSTLTIVFFSFLLTAFLFLILIPFEWTIRPLVLSDISFISIGSLLGSILIGSILFHGSYQLMIKLTSAFVASFILYGGVVCSILFGILFFQEHLTFTLFVGAVLVLLGVFLATTYTQLKKRI